MDFHTTQPAPLWAWYRQMRIADRVLSGHADFLTSLAISVVSWKSKDEVRRYCAVRRGVLRVDVTWSPPLLFD